MQRYRLQLFFFGIGSQNNFRRFALKWAVEQQGYVPGDFYIRAIKEETDADKFNEMNYSNNKYTKPMTIDEIRLFVLADLEKAGNSVHDCMGLFLEDDNDKKVFFEPIKIRK